MGPSFRLDASDKENALQPAEKLIPIPPSLIAYPSDYPMGYSNSVYLRFKWFSGPREFTSLGSIYWPLCECWLAGRNFTFKYLFNENCSLMTRLGGSVPFPSQWRLGFIPVSACVRFVCDILALGQVCILEFRPPMNIIYPVLPSHLNFMLVLSDKQETPGKKLQQYLSRNQVHWKEKLFIFFHTSKNLIFLNDHSTLL
jgi:hypothetical protein